MKKFKFGLEKILNLRSWSESDARIELGKSVSTLNGIENNLKSIAQKRVELGENQKNDSLRNVDVYDRYYQYLEQQKEHLLKEATQAEIVVEQKRGEWINAKADLKAMENLKERRIAEYKKEQNKIVE